MGNMVIKVCLTFLNKGGDLGVMNSAFVVLISKIKEPKLVTYFKPISLYTMLYKIIFKTISNRLKDCLLMLISPE